MLLSWHIWCLIKQKAFEMKIKHRGKGYRKMFRMCWGKTVRIERRGFHAFHPVISLPLLAVRSTETQESLLWAPGTNRGLTVSREHQASRHDPSPSISTIWIIHSTPVALYSHTSSLCHDFYRYHFEPFSKAQECTSVHYNYNQQSKQWALKIYCTYILLLITSLYFEWLLN